jgi:hypothetical protein
MPRTLDVLMVALLLAVAAWTFHVKGQSEAALERTAILEKKIALEREAIDLLAADWSLLTSPQRLEKLQAHFGADLKLEAVSADRIGRISDVPLKSDLPPQAEPDMREALSEPDARTRTGSIAGAKAAGKPGKAGGDGH